MCKYVDVKPQSSITAIENQTTEQDTIVELFTKFCQHTFSAFILYNWVHFAHRL